MEGKLFEVQVTTSSKVVNRPIVDLHLPDSLLVILIERESRFIIPYGGTVLLVDDTLMVLSDEASLKEVLDRFSLVVA